MTTLLLAIHVNKPGIPLTPAKIILKIPTSTIIVDKQQNQRYI